MSRRILGLLLLLLLAACRGPAVREAADAGEVVHDPQLHAAQAAREAALAAQPRWTMHGRLAVSAAGDGGSGRIVWVQDGDDYTITLSAPVTRRSWVLSRRGDDIRLAGLDGGERRGVDAEALLADATGWRLPVQALAAWLRGASADGGGPGIRFRADGLPARIEERGWVVDYREWDAAAELPRRVFARQGEATVRLVVERWETP